MSELLELVQEHREFVELVKNGQCTPEAVHRVEESAREHDLDYIIEDTPQAIQQGLDGVQRVAHIVRAMKDFSHVQREEVTAADLNHSINSTLTVARNEYKYHADVVTELGEIPLVECYIGEINQVLLNLLVNAAHAIADTQKRGTITIRSQRLDEDHVEISFTDTGTGIPPEVRNRIFDPFFTTKEIGKGTGQGLTMAHQTVVRKHGGSLTFDTEMGKGTTFRIRLPVKATAASGVDTQEGDA
jgi:signal transduction histidine kinase